MKFVHMDSSEALDVFVREQCSSLAKRIAAHPRKYKLQMSVRPESKKKDGSIKTFRVDGAILIPRQEGVRASKTSSDPHKAVEQVIASLEKQVRRMTEKQERSRTTIGKSLKPVHEFKWELSLK